MRLIFAVLCMFCLTSAARAEEQYLKNVADLQWLIKHAKQIGRKVTEIRFALALDQDETSVLRETYWNIDCDTWRWPMPRPSLQNLSVRVINDELAMIEGWMKRTVSSSKVGTVPIHGMFRMGVGKNGMLVIGDAAGAELGQSLAESRADALSFYSILDEIVAGCAAGWQAELAKSSK